MNTLLSVATLAAIVSFAAPSLAAPQPIKGSDTLAAAVTEAITQLGLDASLQYVGGGSGQGEAALLAGTQGVAPMSRSIAAQVVTDAAAKGVTISQHAIGLDGISVFVKFNESVFTIALPTLKSIFGGEDGSGSAAACASPTRVTRFEQIPGVTQKTGVIHALRRNNDSGTTDAFKALVGVKGFCADVTIKDTTDEIKSETSTDPLALGYAGENAENPQANRALAIGKTEAGPFVSRSAASVRDLTYPLARRLYVNVGTSATRPLTVAEQALVDNLLDRSFADPILAANGFVTCAATGCP